MSEQRILVKVLKFTWTTCKVQYILNFLLYSTNSIIYCTVNTKIVQYLFYIMIFFMIMIFQNSFNFFSEQIPAVYLKTAIIILLWNIYQTHLSWYLSQYTEAGNRAGQIRSRLTVLTHMCKKEINLKSIRTFSASIHKKGRRCMEEVKETNLSQGH